MRQYYCVVLDKEYRLSRTTAAVTTELTLLDKNMQYNVYNKTTT